MVRRFSANSRRRQNESNMKKIYMMPALQVSEAQVQNMMAVSLQDGTADPDKPVLTKEDNDWNIWDDED